jgi:hypothetical protein
MFYRAIHFTFVNPVGFISFILIHGMKQKILIAIAITFIAALAIGYIQFQEPIHPTAVVALERQQPLLNQAKIVVANTPQERANLERFDKSTFDGWNKKKLDTLQKCACVRSIGCGL